LCVGTAVDTAHACIAVAVVVTVGTDHAGVVATLAVLLLAEFVQPCVLALQLALLMLVLLFLLL
jgi:hypothetical protein